MKLTVNNNKVKIDGPLKLENHLYKQFAIRHPNAFHIRRYMPKGWDGKVHFLTEAGYIYTGLLPDLIEAIQKYDKKEKIQIEYNNPPELSLDIPKELNGWVPRPYQLDAIKSIVNRSLLGKPFPRGIIKAATNAGKNLVMAFLYKTFNVPTILVFNRKDLYETALEEIPQILGKDEVGVINAKTEIWKPFMICMAQTLASRMAYYKSKLGQFQACFIDECDLSNNKTYKNIILNLYNTQIRVGLSGTYSVSPMAKYGVRDTNIKAFFSGIVYEIKNEELQKLGFSSDVIIKIHKGNTDVIETDYRLEYEYGIIKNKARNKAIVKRTVHYTKRKQLPILVTAKFHKHLEKLQKLITKANPELRVEMVHHKTVNRAKLIKEFKEGNIDILIGSMIVKRGKNFPLMKAMIHAGGGDSEADILQLFGRATRTHKDKQYTFFEDFFDEGNYLKRHSKHRLMAFKRENLEVIEKYKM